MKYVEMIEGNEVTTYTTTAPSGREVITARDIRYSPNTDAISSYDADIPCDYYGNIIAEALEDLEEYKPNTQNAQKI